MLKIGEMSWESWNTLGSEDRDSLICDIAAMVGGELAEPDSLVLMLEGLRFAFVPGGSAQIGWDGIATLTEEQRAAWMRSTEFDGTFELFCSAFFGPQRTATCEPLLVEVSPKRVLEYIDDVYCEDVEEALRQAVGRQGFRLLSSNEWEYAARAGRTTVFPWGNEWPTGIPYGDETSFIGHLSWPPGGLELIADPYQVEIVQETDWVRGGDGGTAICGGRPAPESWYSFAFPFQYPRAYFEDCVSETYEAALVRRAVPLVRATGQK